MTALAVPLELEEDESGVLRGDWRGQPIEVDSRTDVARLRLGGFTGSVTTVERFGRTPELRAEHGDPELAEAVHDCVASCEPARAWLAKPGRRVREGWLELPLGDELEAARARLDELVAVVPEWKKLVVEAGQLATERRRLNARAEEERRLAEQSRVANRAIRVYAKRKAMSERYGRVMFFGGLGTWAAVAVSSWFVSPLDELAESSWRDGLVHAVFLGAALAFFGSVLCRWWFLRCPECGQSMRGIDDEHCPRCRTVLQFNPRE
jgi:hypothetical protein